MCQPISGHDTDLNLEIRIFYHGLRGLRELRNFYLKYLLHSRVALVLRCVLDVHCPHKLTF